MRWVSLVCLVVGVCFLAYGMQDDGPFWAAAAGGALLGVAHNILWGA